MESKHTKLTETQYKGFSQGLRGRGNGKILVKPYKLSVMS